MKEMLVYFVGIFGILSLMFLGSFIKNERFRKLFIIVPIILYFIAVNSVKNISVGIDTKIYHEMYILAGKMPFKEMTISNFEPGYVLLSKIFAKANIPFNAFLLAVYTFIYIILGYFVYKNSKNVGLSLLIYMCFMYFTFNLTGIRQSIAIAVVLVAYELLKIKNTLVSFVLFIAVVAVAATFHTSAFVVLPIFFLRKYKIKEESIIFAVFLMLFALLFRDSIFNFLTLDVYDVGEPTAHSFGGLVATVMVFCFLGLVVGKSNIVYTKLNELFFKLEGFLKSIFKLKDKGFAGDKIERKAFLHDFSITVVFFGILASLISSSTVMARIYTYFYIFIIFLIPNTISFQKSKLLRFITICGVAGFFVAFYYIYDLRVHKFDILPYKFFWE